MTTLLRPRLGLPRTKLIAAIVCGTLAIGCGDAEQSCTEVAASTQRIYNGTPDELYFGLAEAETRAIVLIRGGEGHEDQICTGTVIASEWVLTAAHCLDIPGHAVRLPTAGDEDLDVIEFLRHPRLDVALLRLARPLARTGAHAVAPLQLQIGALGQAWFGASVEVAGYGLTDAGQLGTLHFALESLVDVGDTTFVVSGNGTNGACYGDSGGPLLMRSATGPVLVAGLLSDGSTSCVGEDLYIRTAAIAEWAKEAEARTSNPGSARRRCGN